MPQETLTFPPLYCVVGAYRLAHDPSLWKPMWAKCSKAAKQAGIVGLLWALLTWPFQRLFVYYFMSASASVTGFGALYGKLVDTDSDLPVRIPLPSLQSKSPRNCPVLVLVSQCVSCFCSRSTALLIDGGRRRQLLQR